MPKLTAIVGVAALSLLSFGTSAARAQGWQPPSDAERCPSKWGAGDERGAANLMTPELVLRAARLIKTGEVIEMGYPLYAGMPFYGGRVYSQVLKRTNWPPGSNTRGSNEEMITTELGQVGTQIDGFGHQSIGNSLYNCVQMDQVATRTGFSKLGIEKAGAFFVRGVLIDVAAARGVEMLADRYEITAQDLQDALARQKLSLEAGDAVIIHTGFGRLWEKDNRPLLSDAAWRGHWRRGVARKAEPDDRGIGYVLRRGESEPRSETELTCPPDPARRRRDLPDRESQAR